MENYSTRERIELAFDWIDHQFAEVCETVLRWAHQNSWSRNLDGLQSMAEMLRTDFSDCGILLELTRLPDWEEVNSAGTTESHSTGPALLWHLRPNARRRVLLAIHYDTVYPPGTNGQAIGFDGLMLTGPGVADAKGGIVTILWAVRAISKFELASEIGISILLNPDEEIGSPASTSLFEEFAPQYEFALLFEPSLPSGQMVVDRKGSGNFTAVIRGRAAHAGRDLHAGRNAIVHAARLAVEVDSWNDPAIHVSDVQSLTPVLTVNVGHIVGGGSLNQVPSLASVSMNVRVTSFEGMEIVEDRMRELERKYSAAEGYSCQVIGKFHSPPKCVRFDQHSIRLREQVVAAAAACGRKIQWCDTGGACDGNKFSALGLPNVDTMGPTGGNLHSDQEFCDARSLLAAIKVVVHLLASLEHTR